MEFGIFFNGYIPGPAAHDTDAEHLMLIREIEYAIHADKYNWKYAWFGEHHAPHRVLATCRPPRSSWATSPAPTERIHLGSAIMNLSPPDQPPGAQRRARRHARPRHQPAATSGAPAAAPAATRSPASTSWTRTPPRPSGKRWSRRSRACGSRRTTSTTATYFTVPVPPQHPPQALRQGPPADLGGLRQPAARFARAGELGIGAIAFNFEPIFNLKGRIDAYKEAIANCTEPIGQFKNDNVMMTNAVICLNDRERAREIALRRGRGYLDTMVNLYHDTMPKREGAPVWPTPPLRHPGRGRCSTSSSRPATMLCGTPDEVLRADRATTRRSAATSSCSASRPRA